MKVEIKMALTERERIVLDNFIRLMEDINTQVCSALDDNCCDENCPFVNLCGDRNPKEQILNFFNSALQKSLNKETDA